MATGTYTAIASITLGSSASSVTFSSIPQDYRDLVLVANGGSSSAGNISLEVQPNGSGSDGSSLQMRGDGSTDFSQSTSRIFVNFGASNSLFILQALDYSATDKHKTFLARSGTVGVSVDATAGRWAQTVAMTSLVFTDTGGADIDAGSTFALYGIEA